MIVPKPLLCSGVTTKYFSPSHVDLIQFIKGYKRDKTPNKGRPSWNACIRPPTSVPDSTKPKGAPKPTSEMTSYAMYLVASMLTAAPHGVTSVVDGEVLLTQPKVRSQTFVRCV